MNELLKALKQFVTRDIIYIIGGSAILFSFTYCFNIKITKNMPLIIQLFGIAMSYVIGYVVQELFCFMHCTRIYCSSFNPNGLIKKLYERYTRMEIGEITKIDNIEADIEIYKHPTKNVIGIYERIITLKQVGTTIGPCLLFSSIFTLIHIFTNGSSVGFDVALICCSITLGVILIFLGWFKYIQQCKCASKILDDIEIKK
ncbi:MAG: hypothetical protein KAJ52_06180 [Sedimentisphaerales bacterium]|nr:hypothetical protein [Sedimentisphaerales bacterium]